MAYSSWSVTFGEQPSAAKWNILGTNDAHFYSFLGDNLAWQTWTPTLTNLSGGAQTFSKYTTVGKTIHFRFKYTLGGAGVAGLVGFTLPVAMATGYGSDDGQSIESRVLFRDTGSSVHFGAAAMGSSTRLDLFALNASGTYLTTTATTSTIPFTWANTDIIDVSGTYERS